MKFKPILNNEPKLTMSLQQYATLMSAMSKTNMELTFICHVERAKEYLLPTTLDWSSRIKNYWRTIPNMVFWFS